MEKINEIYPILTKDKEFFDEFKEKFINYFTDLIKEAVNFLDKTALRSIADRTYILLFSFDKNPVYELKNFIYTIAKSEVDIKPAFSKAFLYLLKNYIDFIVNKNDEFEKVKTLVDLIDIYLFIIDSAYIEYTKNLKKEIEKTETEKQEIIFKVFKKLLSENENLNLIDFYKEVPVICKAKIKDIVGKKYVIFKFSDCKYKNFYIEGNDIFIKTTMLPKVIKGIIKESDIINGIVKLEKFQLTELPHEKRKYIRVVPKEDIQVLILSNGKKISGIIADISIGGIGFYTKNIEDLKKGDKVNIKFEIENIEIEHTGTIRYVKNVNGVYRVGIEFEYNKKLEDIISEYVVKRQFEIIKELKI